MIKNELVRNIFLFFLLLLPGFSFAQENFVFERMWPSLQQPWYFFATYGITADKIGNIYITDAPRGTVYKLSPDGHLITKWGHTGQGEGLFKYPHHIAYDGADYIYVADANDTNFQKFTLNGDFVSKTNLTEFGLSLARGIAIDQTGNIFVGDVDGKILKIHEEGTTPLIKDGFLDIEGLVVDIEGNLLVLERAGRVIKLNQNLMELTSWSLSGYTWSICIDNENNVYHWGSGCIYNEVNGYFYIFLLYQLGSY